MGEGPHIQGTPHHAAHIRLALAALAVTMDTVSADILTGGQIRAGDRVVTG